MSIGPTYIPLRVHSAYSLLEGAIGLKDLVKWCGKHQVPAVAVTDSNNLFGSLEFAQAAAAGGVQPIMGCVLYLKPQGENNALSRGHGHVQKPDQLLIYVQNETGWRNLIALVSQSFLTPHGGGDAPLLAYSDLEGKTEGLIALSGGLNGAVGRALALGQHARAEEALLHLTGLFPGRLYIEISRHGLADEKRIEPAFIEFAMKHDLPMAATNAAYFIDAAMYEAHDAFLCIAEGAYVGEEVRRRLTPEHRLKTPAEMQALFADLPEALENTVKIARRCAFMAPARQPMLPRFGDQDSELGIGDWGGIGEMHSSQPPIPNPQSPSESEILRAQAREGLEQRLNEHVFTPDMDEAARTAVAAPYRERLEFEIDTIINMKFPGYFLIVSDFIKWSKQHGIPVGPGRGSGAGSLVAWSLLITDLDPLRYGLLFERFLNPQRVSMPDFDVDFCQDRRDEVIAYVQQKYGRDRVAQIITFGKLQARAVLRDVGRVLQMPYGQVDKICKMVPNNPANPVTLKEAIEMEPALKSSIREDETVERLVDISLKLEGLNRHASTHAAGVVIADRPLQELVPLYRDPKSDMPVVQYSMKYAESAGLVKFDFLGLKTLTVLVTAVKMIAQSGLQLDLLKLPEGDKPTYDMLSRGETVGVFQLEGAGMRDTVKKLRPDRLEDIIALVSLYRPGPMDNIPTYIARKHGLEKPDYLHPKIEPILKETYGVIIYQEQVMQIAQVLAGYSLGEADLLRRAMGKKIRSEMEAQRSVFVEKSVAQGVNGKQAKEIFDLIAKFAEYGFNKSHAAAYALIAYQTAYLKANHTVEFIAASMTYDMHNTDKLGVFREDAGRYGIKLLPPDINRSGVLFWVEREGARVEGRGASDLNIQPSTLNPHPLGNIRYALSAIRNVGAAAMQAVVVERERGGAFKDIFDFVTRVPLHSLNKRALEHLIKAGAFDALHPNRAQLIEGLDRALMYGTAVQEEKASDQVSLFASAGSDKPAIPPPPLPQVQDWPSLERLNHEFEAIGFYLSSHPLQAFQKSMQGLGIISSSQLPERLDAGKFSSVRLAGIVTGKKIKASEKGRFAFVQVTDMGGVYEVSIFKEELLNAHRDRLENGQMLMLTCDGKLEESGPRLIVQSIASLEQEVAKRPANARGSLRIVVNNGTAVPQIQKLLGIANGAGIPVQLATRDAAGRVAEIRLPGKYAVTPVVIDNLRNVSGVIAAEEV